MWLTAASNCGRHDPGISHSKVITPSCAVPTVGAKSRIPGEQPAVAVREVDVGEDDAGPADRVRDGDLLVLTLKRVDDDPDGRPPRDRPPPRNVSSQEKAVKLLEPGSARGRPRR